MKEITKRYSNGEMTVVWKPSMCIHSMNCFKGLGKVFDPKKRPWVTVDAATTKEIVDQIKKCPSGALSYETEGQEVVENPDLEIIVEMAPNGPLMVYGNLSVKSSDGSIARKSKATAFCRCGASGNKPYCDGSHNKVAFKG